MERSLMLSVSMTFANKDPAAVLESSRQTDELQDSDTLSVSADFLDTLIPGQSIPSTKRLLPGHQDVYWWVMCFPNGTDNDTEGHVDTIEDYCIIKFDQKQIEKCLPGESIVEPERKVDGLTWSIEYFPCGVSPSFKDYVSVFVQLMENLFKWVFLVRIDNVYVQSKDFITQLCRPWSVVFLSMFLTRTV
uniref:MATH domain-containing protein n=1 Tax=Panagrellus redivivus TaxID=6233 RepID=A0A7E4VSA2_PANRE